MHRAVWDAWRTTRSVTGRSSLALIISNNWALRMARANRGASGENAIVRTVARADVVVGTLGIMLAQMPLSPLLDDPACAGEALTLLERSGPDLICLDLLMPDRTGVSLYAELRAHERLGDVPVLILSGLGAREELGRMLTREGELPAPAGFIEKPVDIERFLATVRRLLDEGSVRWFVPPRRIAQHGMTPGRCSTSPPTPRFASTQATSIAIRAGSTCSLRPCGSAGTTKERAC